MKEIKVQPGSVRADEKYKVVVTEEGPYAVYGKPSLDEQFITRNSEGANWNFRKGQDFKMDTEPVYLCRCGASKNKPYCDASHVTITWEDNNIATREPLLEGANVYPGPVVSLSDNEKYCVFARFCDAKQRVWNMVAMSDDPQTKQDTIHEANMCPGGRLSAWENSTQKPYEPHYEPGLSIIQDPPLGVSAGLWIKGGIPIETEDGKAYEVRNRQVVCRCGHSGNMPYCNGMHASVKFEDNLSNLREAKKEKVL